MARNRYSLGIVLIVIAALLILGKIGVFGFVATLFWPLVFLLPALLLHFLYFSRIAPSAVLVPGGLFIVYTVLFLICNWFGWHLMHYLWPFLLFGAAAGLYEWYMFDPRSAKGALFASAVITAVSFILFVLTLLSHAGILAIAIILLIAGIIAFVWKARPA